MPTRYFIGLSAGPSLLGVDAALARVDGVGGNIALQLEHFVHAPFGTELRELLGRAFHTPTPQTKHLATIHRVLGESLALTVQQLLSGSRRAARDVLAIGCPGISLWHDGGGRFPSSLSLGMSGIVAERTGLTVISDFATRDLALGGQGVPGAAFVDALLFHHRQEYRVLLHLGSVANVISLPAQLEPSWRNVIGFQAAPCTMLLDGLMRLLTQGREAFDAGGKNAVQGRCLEPLVERWMQNHFFQERPPKCVPCEEFGADFLARAVAQAKQLNGNLHDVLCTMTHFVARAIVESIRSHIPTTPTRVLVSGRGLRNGLLLHVLGQRFGAIPVEATDAHGVPAEARQALGYAGLACLAIDGVPANVPSVTGASGPRLLGQLTPGDSRNWARCLEWMTRPSVASNAA